MSNKYIYNHNNDYGYDDDNYIYHGNDGIDDDDRAADYDDCYGD